MEDNTQKKSWLERFPNGIVLLFGIIILVGLLSYIIPAGKYETMIVDGRKLIDPNSFHFVQQKPVAVFDFFTVIPAGLQSAGALIFMIFSLAALLVCLRPPVPLAGRLAGLPNVLVMNEAPGFWC
jgi:uncharacterized ion transporter superfamily protein YfcC